VLDLVAATVNSNLVRTRKVPPSTPAARALSSQRMMLSSKSITGDEPMWRMRLGIALSFFCKKSTICEETQASQPGTRLITRMVASAREMEQANAPSLVAGSAKRSRYDCHARQCAA